MPPRYELNDRFKAHIRARQNLRMFSAAALSTVLIFTAAYGLTKTTVVGAAATSLAHAALAFFGNFLPTNTVAISPTDPEHRNVQPPSQTGAAIVAAGDTTQATSSPPLASQSKASASAASQRIDQLANVTLTNPIIIGGSLSGTSGASAGI